MAFHPEDRVVASCSEDRSIKLWNLDDGGLLSTMNVDGEVESVHWSPCGTKIAAACNDYGNDNYCVKILNSETGALLCALNVGYAFSRFSTRIFLPARPLFSRFSTRISV